ncbi:hypothetical protein [Salsipaludibacter albus]|uniref:hypothetical protein n=1 Tax=Salsipaludibacter albus TaxID=2849650 RepID=UPI001EE3D5ED|nr:hypothetical protein [Salsipaludibacter albus]MBY5162849.1 hypothetical protein [Salsipaludibacter albus]
MSAAQSPEPMVPEHDDDEPAPDTDPRVDDVPTDPQDPRTNDDPAADPLSDPRTDDRTEELSADVTALDDDATPQALDDSSSVVESAWDDTGVRTAPSDGMEDEHAEEEAVEDLPDDADGIPSTT